MDLISCRCLMESCDYHPNHCTTLLPFRSAVVLFTCQQTFRCVGVKVFFFSKLYITFLEMKLLKPHSKCCTQSPANCREEFWRHFLNTLVCQSFPPLPPTPSLRIISPPPPQQSASHLQNKYGASFPSCPSRPSKTSLLLWQFLKGIQRTGQSI